MRSSVDAHARDGVRTVMGDASVKVVLVGAGAVVREYQAPAALAAERHGAIEVLGVVDRDARQLAVLREKFPNLRTSTELGFAAAADLALVATPPQTHLDLGRTLMRDHACHLLVEKPVAATVQQAYALQVAAAETGKLLGVAHFRRFLPALDALASYVSSQALGPVISVTVDEGGLFRWPATAAFFSPDLAGGGVTLDIGIHVLELLVAWLGIPRVVDYTDDAMGGLETNSRADLEWPGGETAAIRLSWDVALANRWVLDFERGRITWRAGNPTEFLLEMQGVPGVQAVTIRQRAGSSAEHSTPSPGFLAAFTRQWCDMADAVRTGGRPRVESTAVTALELVEQMYRGRRLMSLPHLTVAEHERALELAKNGTGR